MDIKNILIATVVVAAVGVAIAVLLSIAEKLFHVDVDERESAVRECLAGNNCGACGYAGCDALAKAIVNGEAPVTACTVAGQAGADKIAAIMGVEAGSVEKQVAFVRCSGTTDLRQKSLIITAPKHVLPLNSLLAEAICHALTAVWVTEAVLPCVTAKQYVS